MTRKVVVVGLGPAGPELLAPAVLDALASVPPERRFLRTHRHPAAAAVIGARSFDQRYETATTLDEVYEGIVADLVDAATQGTVVYAVPGSPLVAERTVELLRAAPDVDVEVVPALSFLDLAWARLAVDPLAAGVRLVDAHRFAVEAAGERGPLLLAQCDSRLVLSEVKLAVEAEGADRPVVTVLQRLGLPDERVSEVAWDELDRAVAPDHLTTLWIPTLAAPVAVELARFAELVRTLRAECPWDRQQTHASLTRHLLEETYEALEAIAALDGGEPSAVAHFEEELGDVLFQVVFHATLAAEEGWFTLADVARTVHDKLVRRHPHVFAAVAVDGADDVVRNWERIKQDEKGRTSAFDGIPGDLPALLYALKVQRKAQSLGLAVEAPAGDDLGAALFHLVGSALAADVDPEAALRAATAEFRARAEAAEGAAAHRR